MKNTFIKNNIAYITFVAIVWVSCGKDQDAAPDLEDGKSKVIYDLAGDVEASVGTGVDGKESRTPYTFLFRFKDQRQIWIRNAADSAQWLKTDQWDIAFTGPYNSEIYLNNAQQEKNPGFQGPVNNSAIVMVNRPYHQVDVAPSDNVFDQSAVSVIGWASGESSQGWFKYSMDNHIMQALPNRTYVLRLPNGKYAKLQVINAYKGNPPAITNLNWPAPYYTFRYFVQEDGSTELKTN